MQANRWLVIRWDFTALRSHFGDHCCENHSLCCSTEDSSPSCVSPGFYLYLCSDPSPLFNPLLSLPYLGTHLILMYSFKLIFSVVLFVFLPIPLPTLLRSYEIVPRSVPLSLTDIYICLFVCLFV